MHEGTTIAVITHDRDIAASLPRRIELRDGRVVSDSGLTGGGAASLGETVRMLR